MADNTTLDPGTGGDVIATDDVAGVKYQRVKLVDSTADSTTPIGTGGGTEATALRVTVATDSTGVLSVDDNGSSLTVDNGGTFATQESQIITDNAGFTDGTSKVFPVGLIFDEVAGTALTENDVAAPRIDSKRAQIGVIEDEATRGRRLTITASNAAKVDGSAVTQPVSDAGGSLTVDNGGTFAVQDSEKVADDAAFTVGTTKVNPVGFFADQTATDSVNEGDIGAARMTLDRKQIVTMAPSADTEGLTIGTLVSAATTNATSLKASAGKVYGWYIYNDGAAEVYFKFYNKASSPTVGTDTPVMTLGIPAGGAANVEYTNGIAFATGIAYAVTTGATTADTGAVALSQVVINILYQ